MAGFLSLYAKTERVNLVDIPDTADGEYWVDVKVSITKADADSAQRKLLKNRMSLQGTVSNIDGDLDIPAYEEELVVKAITDWNLTDERGALLPLSPVDALRKSVQALPASIVTQVYDKVNELNGRRSKQESDNFPS